MRQALYGLILILFTANESLASTYFQGDTPKNALMILPGGLHTKNPTQFSGFQFYGIRYKSIHLATFVNSFGERTQTLGITRNIVSLNNIKLRYFAGLLNGYHGKLATVRGIPFKKSPLWRYNINPVIGINSTYALSEKLQLSLIIEPLVILYGLYGIELNW